MAAILDSDMKLFPLELYLESSKVTPPKQPPILLSRFKTLDYEALEKMERARIYDTGDLELISDDQLLRIGFTIDEVTEFKADIEKELQRFSKLPLLLLDFPENYGFIFYQKIDDKLLFELFWKGLTFWWKINKEKLDNFMVELLNFLQSLGLPELISFSNKLPMLDTVELPIFDISIYIGNFDTQLELEKMMEILQLNPNLETTFKLKETLILAYLANMLKK